LSEKKKPLIPLAKKKIQPSILFTTTINIAASLLLYKMGTSVSTMYNIKDI
jgi:hypothetical protein